jgi:molybdopterin synthase sulfur carrier subunit
MPALRLRRKARWIVSVKIHLHPDMYYLIDNNEIVETTGGTVGECLGQLIARYPGVGELVFDKDGRLKTFIEIYVNRMAAYPDELEKKVNDGDEIHLMIMIAGG